MVAELRGARRAGLGVFLAIASVSCAAFADDDDAPEPSKVRRKERAESKTEITLAAYAGAYLEEPSFGPLLEAGLGFSAASDPERYRFGVGYLYDPFTTKTSSFPEEDQSTGSARLVQTMHEVDAFLGFQTRFGKRHRLSAKLEADAWFPEVALDHRLRGEIGLKWRFGDVRGFYVALGLGTQLKYFPKYLVADRRIDQAETTGEVEFGYSFEPNTKLGARGELSYTRYLDARYDVLLDGGAIERAPDSKVYFSRSLRLFGSFGELEPFVFGAFYQYRVNDSIRYDRRMTGRDASGTLVAKFIPDYYDYDRHDVGVDVGLRVGRRFRVDTEASYFLRDFDSYEARDADNVWTGELRHDHGFELGYKLGFRLTTLEALGVESGVWLNSFGSRLTRRSNMRREVSLATNFDVTRVFLGFAIDAP